MHVVWMRHLRLILDCFRINLSSAMEYRAGFLMQTAGMILNDAFFLFFWWIVFRQAGSIGGYGYSDVMTIWALSASTFGLLHIVFGNVRRINHLAQSGELDIYLLQPRDPFVHAHCARMSLSAWGDLVYAIALYVVLSGFSPVKWLMFLLFTVAGALLLGAVMSLADSLVFWLGDSTGITRLITEFMLTFSLYPDTIFRPGVKWLIYTILPTAFVVFIPSRLLSAFDLPVFLGVLAVDAFAVWLARTVFRAGLKRYASGSRIGARM